VGSEGKSEELNERCFPLYKLWVGDLASVLHNLGVLFCFSAVVSLLPVVHRLAFRI